MRVALLADGWGGLNGVAEVYRHAIGAMPQGIEVIPVGCQRGRGAPEITVPAVGGARSRLMPEVDSLVPKPQKLRDALRGLNVDLVHVTGPGPLGMAGLAAARKLDLPVLAAFHTDLGSYAGRWLRAELPVRLVERSSALFYRRAQAWVAPSEWARRRLAALLATQPERIGVLEQGVDANRFAPSHPVAPLSLDRQPSILAVSRLSAEKSLDILVRAVAGIRSPSPRLVLVGRGPELRRLRRLAESLGVSLRLTGPLDGERLGDAYRSATLFCLPSTTETCGQVLLEAQASGLACVVSPSGAASETIAHGGTGVVAGGDTPAHFASALRRLLLDPAARAHLGRRARGHALSRPWDRTALSLAAAYRSTSGISVRSLTNRHSPTESPRFSAPCISRISC